MLWTLRGDDIMARFKSIETSSDLICFAQLRNYKRFPEGR